MPCPRQATLPHVADFYNSTLGTFLPKIDQPAQYLVDVGIFFALLAMVVYWFLTSRTTFGYEVRVIGQNPKAARYAGIPIKRNIFAIMAIAGAFSGLAGGLQLMGQFPYQLIAQTFSIQTTGFDAIGVALARTNNGYRCSARCAALWWATPGRHDYAVECQCTRRSRLYHPGSGAL